MQRAERVAAAHRALLIARSAIEAVTFTLLAASFHLVDPPGRSLPLIALGLGLWGAGLVLASGLKNQVSERGGAALAVGVAAAWIAVGLIAAPREGGALGILVRALGFAILGEAFLWRTMSIARDPSLWHEALNALSVAALLLAMSTLLPPPFDHGPIPLLALALVILGGFTLSLARAAEELRDSTATLRASAARSGAGVTTLVLGVVAVVAAVVEPRVQDALAPFWSWLGDLALTVLLAVLQPIVFVLVTIVTAVLQFILSHLSFSGLPELLRGLPQPGLDDEQLSRAVSRDLQPWLFGGAALLVTVVALLVGIVLVDRLVRERRAVLPAGATLDRESIEGLGFLDALRTLRGPDRRPRRAPRDDGSPAAAARLLYWRLLALAEKRGAGWRRPHETPAAHLTRIAEREPGWAGAAPIVVAFETVRYAEQDPPAEALRDARAALDALERASLVAPAPASPAAGVPQ